MEQNTPATEDIKNNEATPENKATPETKEAKKPKKNDKNEEIAKLKAELEEEKDKYLRMLAEYDNFRRRTAKEKQGVWADAVADTIKELLPIADNLDRAAHADGDAGAIRAGLDMTMTAMNAMLTKLGMTVYGEVGDAFDPNIHNAVMHVDDDTLGEGVIAEVFQRGYRMGDKIIRFAMVKVAN